MKKRDVFDKCEVAGCTKFTLTQGVKHCSRHLQQLTTFGKILERTIYDPNEIELLETHALVYLYDKDCNVKAKTLIDLADVEEVSKYKWRFGNGIYVDNPKVGYLHSFITGFEETDHRNHNKLDNRRDNLRDCSHVQNCMNRKMPAHNTTGVKGVHWRKREEWYEAYINIDSKFITLGKFSSIMSAAVCYNEAASKYHGDFAQLNDLSALTLKLESGEIVNNISTKSRRKALN